MGANPRVMIIGIIMIVIALLMFGIILDSVDALLDWSTVGGGSITDFTGLEALVTISPLLIFIGLLAGGGWLTFKGFKGDGGGGGRRSRKKLH